MGLAQITRRRYSDPDQQHWTRTEIAEAADEAETGSLWGKLRPAIPEARSYSLPESPQLQSRLMTLPGELRNRIYSYVVASEGEIYVTQRLGTIHANYEVMFRIPQQRSTCRMLHRELRASYYEENIFRLREDTLKGDCIRHFRELSGSASSLITQVQIQRSIFLKELGRVKSMHFDVKKVQGKIELDPVTGESLAVQSSHGVTSFGRQARWEFCDCELRQLAQDCKGDVMLFLKWYVDSIGEFDDHKPQYADNSISLSPCSHCGTLSSAAKGVRTTM